MPAPAATAARITSGLKVSMLIGTVFFLDRYRGSTRAGGFATDVEQIGAFLDQLQAMCDRSLGGVVRAAVGERVRGDVDDAHDPGTVEAQDAAGAIELGRGIEHGQSCRDNGG
ncbi:hypothetical protein G6F22_020727 [Rhizopus arrhizus]|nr:hypothetical protein G6F22_020727 [Rhizopus arrhizus]